MEIPVQIMDYCNKVCEQIRWKKAKKYVYSEIEQHLIDQRDSYLVDGKEELTATEQAILQMGDPVMVGEELDRTHKPKPQWFLLLLVGIVLLLGCISTYYVKNILGHYQRGHIFEYLFAFLVLLICYHLDFAVLGRYPRLLYVATLVFTIFATVTAQGDPSRQVVPFIGYAIPIQYLFFCYPLVFALFVYSARNKRVKGLVFSMLAYIPLAYFLTSIPSMSTFFAFSVIAFSILCLGVSRNWFNLSKKTGFLVLCVPTFLVTVYLGYNLVYSPYLHNGFPFFTFVYFENPIGLQETVREILGNTPFLGETTYDFTSIPTSIDKTNFEVAFLLEFRLAYLVSQYGFVAFLLIIGIYTAIALFSLIYSLKQRSILGTLVSFSIVGTFVSQCVFSMVDSIGYGNFSGIPVPFLAHGQTSLLINSALLGFMLSVFRTGSVFLDVPQKELTANHFNNYKIKKFLPTVHISVDFPSENKTN